MYLWKYYKSAYWKLRFFKIICNSLAFPYSLNLISDIPDWFYKEIKSNLWSFPVFFFVCSFFDEELFSFTSSSPRLFCNDCLAIQKIVKHVIIKLEFIGMYNLTLFLNWYFFTIKEKLFSHYDYYIFQLTKNWLTFG